ncbi:MAG: DEAD/DEAH box helicase [Verrucomicrobia bacterium]|nr:DEAD/DEAH box helicase [Verrucomicrobiota bacterium]MBU4289448.1 DEAD/DEAH box helicase [Verrucomicrobiota bacterium]MBU4428718.1 DEAD/DEAH box helicase [Verrucomicrobiota bacterium]MBU4497262.1 DEAD/DEAH box helicase [Verrucomicrobiota bacterium]MCG2679155.1 DEAD/DEAH box helicase [Kiritimatiellia bacterium]
MQITDYHAKYYAHELTKRCPSDSVEKLTASLLDAQVDLNPHQVEAALFAFKSPFSTGAILADEVGLGKTIEAGIVLSQMWAEQKRKILIIVPSSLRKQWNQELSEKFFLPSEILESKPFNNYVKEGRANPFQQDRIVICSYHFACNKADYAGKVQWDLVIFDEAHRLRNVYKPENKIARTLKDALGRYPKLLLTATPLQNSLLELYGLVSFIDEYTFGDLKSFKNQYARITTQDTFAELKARLTPICKRTLRRQVLEYVKYTNRIPITQEFVPTKEEERLYDLVSDYLRRPNLQALPASQRSLMTLVLRKLLASSTFAIAGALNTLIRRLEARLKNAKLVDPGAELSMDFEGLDEIRDEWNDEDADGPVQEQMTKENAEAIAQEIKDLKEFRVLAESIVQNAKGKALIKALKAGFDKAVSLGASKKAVIFTESCRTQEYLMRLLSNTEYADKFVLFNGQNSHPQAKQIYGKWFKKHEGTDLISGSRTADLRASLVDHFRDTAQILIATEAAAEGINLQFCSLVVNYDLPWNPQRIEQRIGRCHRYGQKHDVVVVNFLNKKNAADQRVYQLLAEKFQLFSGVFGASDEVLGSIESGVDFEKRIVAIYQTCRTQAEIEVSFDQLQKDLSGEIDETLKVTRQQLLENFDEEVHEKLRVNLQASRDYLNRYESLLWRLTAHALANHATIDDSALTFDLTANPFSTNSIPLGRYRFGREVADGHHYRFAHPLAQQILRNYKERQLPGAEVCFDYSASPTQITVLEPLVKKSGWLKLHQLTIASFEAEDHLLWAGITDDGQTLSAEQCRRLFGLAAISGKTSYTTLSDESALKRILQGCEKSILQTNAERNAGFFDAEMGKLEHWSEDMKTSLEIKLKQLDIDVKMRKAEARKITNLEEKVKAHREIKDLEKSRNDMRLNLYQAQDDVERQKERLIEQIEARLKQNVKTADIFTIRWRVL